MLAAARAKRWQKSAGHLQVIPRTGLSRQLSSIAQHSAETGRSVVVTLGAHLSADRAKLVDCDNEDEAAAAGFSEADSCSDDDGPTLGRDCEGSVLSTLVFQYAEDSSIAKTQDIVSSRIKGTARPANRSDLKDIMATTPAPRAQFPALQHLHAKPLSMSYKPCGELPFTVRFGGGSAVRVTLVSDEEQQRRAWHGEAAVVDSLTAGATANPDGTLAWDLTMSAQGLQPEHAFSDALDGVARAAPVHGTSLQLLPRKGAAKSGLVSVQAWGADEAAALLGDAPTGSDIAEQGTKLKRWLEECTPDSAAAEQRCVSAAMRVGGLRLLGAALRNVLIDHAVDGLELHVTDQCLLAAAAVPASRSSNSSSSKSSTKADPQAALRSVAEKHVQH
jgi:hypothetical protein